MHTDAALVFVKLLICVMGYICIRMVGLYCVARNFQSERRSELDNLHAENLRLSDELAIAKDRLAITEDAMQRLSEVVRPRNRLRQSI